MPVSIVIPNNTYTHIYVYGSYSFLEAQRENEMLKAEDVKLSELVMVPMDMQVENGESWSWVNGWGGDSSF